MIETFELSLGRFLSLREISESLSRTNAQVLETIRMRIDEYTLLFGIKPLNLEYRPEVGFVLRADSQVGYFALDYFAIRINPKILGLELSKVLMMAQKTNSGFLNIENSRIQSTLISDINFSAFELFSLSFLDCLEKVIRNGMGFGWEESDDLFDATHGEIRINEWISTGKSLPIPRSEVQRDIDTPINRFLVKALNLIIRETSNPEIRSFALELQPSMDGVDVERADDSIDTLTTQVIGYPREDYKKIFVFAKALLEGGRFQGEVGQSSMPSFVLNLDIIFEQYCAFMLQQILDSKIYDVKIQQPYSHDSHPEIQGKIEPDIVVRNKINEKCAVIDTKNKSVFFDSNKSVSLPSQDIYQLVYYAQSLKAESAILLYPGFKSGKEFPIQGSESPEEYQRKIERFMTETSNSRYLIFPDSARVVLAPMAIDLSGSLENTELSIISLAFFIGEILK